MPKYYKLGDPNIPQYTKNNEIAYVISDSPEGKAMGKIKIPTYNEYINNLISKNLLVPNYDPSWKNSLNIKINEDNINKLYNDTYTYIYNYLGSPGYMSRTNKSKEQINDIKKSLKNTGILIQDDPNRVAMYDSKINKVVVYTGLNNPKHTLNNPIKEILAHELGHKIDLGQRNKIFNNKHKNVNAHDAKWAETYADLIAFRQALFDSGIYDSRSTEPFTKEHYFKFLNADIYNNKKVSLKEDINNSIFPTDEDFINSDNKKHIRLLQQFNMEDVIKLMNTIAYNKSTNPVERFRKYRKGGKAALAARSRKPDLRRVDMSKVTTTDNLNRKIDREAYAQLQDSLIARNYPLPLRLAILATAMQEGSPGSYGVGGGGYLGLSSLRMPKSYLGNTPVLRGKQISYLLNDLETTHSDNWLDGGEGGIVINSGQEGYNMFWNTNNSDSATLILNKSYVRPRDRQDAWNNRTKVSRNLKNKLK